jgi:hypothetical protein
MPTDGMQSRGVGLRWLMVLIVVLAVVPIFALHLVRLQAGSEAAMERAYAQAAVLAEGGVAAQTRLVDEARQLLEVLSKIPAVRSAALPACEQVLSSVEKDREWLTGLFVVGPSGKGICGGSPVVRTLDVSDREYFKNAVESRPVPGQ